MKTIKDKIESFGKEDLEEFIRRTSHLEFMYGSASIKRMYNNWVRNLEEKRDFETCLLEKYALHKKTMLKRKESFLSYQVGVVFINWEEPSYEVRLVGEDPYTVKWADWVVDRKARLRNSLKDFCIKNGVSLTPSRTPNCLIIKTEFKP